MALEALANKGVASSPRAVASKMGRMRGFFLFSKFDFPYSLELKNEVFLETPFLENL